MDKEYPIGLQFAIVNRAFRRQVDDMLAEKDLTGVQLSILGQLNKLEGEGAEEINQRDLEKAAHVSHSTMTEIVKRLEKKGFVRCCPGMRDGRCKRIEATPLAKQLGDELIRLDENVFAALCSGMEDAEKTALRAALKLMLSNAESFGGGKGCEKKK